MRQGFTSFWIALVSIILLVGCGRDGSGSPVAPSTGDTALQQVSIRGAADAANRHLLGLWEVGISDDRSVVEIVPARDVRMHSNVLRLLEVNPCSDCLKIGNIRVVQPNVIEA